MTSRREALKYGSLGIAAPLFAKRIAADSTGSKTDESANPDLTILNNADKRKSVQLKIYKDEGDSTPIFSKGYGLQGHNNPSKSKGEKTMDSYSIDVSGDGEYFVIGKAPSNEEDSTHVTLTEDGIPDGVHITFAINQDGSLRVYAAG